MMLTKHDSVLGRMHGELLKAIHKYGGNIAMQEEGNMDYDAFDNTINELVGLIRYGEIIRARAKLLPIPQFAQMAIIKVADSLIRFGFDKADALIMIRREMLSSDIVLGIPDGGLKS